MKLFASMADDGTISSCNCKETSRDLAGLYGVYGNSQSIMFNSLSIHIFASNGYCSM